MPITTALPLPDAGPGEPNHKRACYVAEALTDLMFATPQPILEQAYIRGVAMRCAGARTSRPPKPPAMRAARAAEIRERGPAAVEDYLARIEALLPAGTRVRHRRHHDLTGRISNFEFHITGEISPIPYCIRWDDGDRACDVLGMLFVYGSNDTVEPIEP